MISALRLSRLAALLRLADLTLLLAGLILALLVLLVQLLLHLLHALLELRGGLLELLLRLPPLLTLSLLELLELLLDLLKLILKLVNLLLELLILEFSKILQRLFPARNHFLIVRLNRLLNLWFDFRSLRLVCLPRLNRLADLSLLRAEFTLGFQVFLLLAQTLDAFGFPIADVAARLNINTRIHADLFLFNTSLFNTCITRHHRERQRRDAEHDPKLSHDSLLSFRISLL